jgi:hypothetical protein
MCDSYWGFHKSWWHDHLILWTGKWMRRLLRYASFLRALVSAWPNFSTPHSPLGSCIWPFWNHRSKQVELLCYKSSRFLPDLLMWNVAAPSSPSWLLRANVAIFSLIFLKCGCKKLLVLLASLGAEQDGCSCQWQEWPASLPPTSSFAGCWCPEKPVGSWVPLPHPVPQLHCCWQRCSCYSVQHVLELKWLTDVCGLAVGCGPQSFSCPWHLG